MADERSRAAASDTELARACGREPVDEAAWLELWNRHSAAVRGCIRCVLGRAADGDADDLTQELFVRLRTRLQNYDESRGALRSYLLTMARSMALDRLRSSRLEQALTVPLTDEIRVFALSAPRGVPLERFRVKLEERLAAIEDTQHLAVYALLIRGTSPNQIIEKTGLSPAKIYRLRRKCIRMVRDILAEVCVDDQGASRPA